MSAFRARWALSLIWLGACAGLAGGLPLRAQSPEPRFNGPSSQTLHQILNDYWEWRLAAEPELATRMGRREPNDRWSDWSRVAREQARGVRQEYLERMLFLSPGTLNPADYLSAILVEHELQTQLAVRPLLDLGLVSPTNGLHARVFATIRQMPAETPRDYENILSRLRGLPRLVDQTIAVLDEQLGEGKARPMVVVDRMLEQLRTERERPGVESPILEAFSRFPDAFAATTQRRLRAAALAAYADSFVPSWQRLERYLQGVYRPRARQEPGLSALPDGRAAYAGLVRSYTTTRLTPDEIHETGLREVSRIEGQMRDIAREYGFTGSLAEFEEELGRRRGMRFESADETMAYTEDVLASVTPRLPQLFRRVPRAALRVRPMPAGEAGTATSTYTAGAADGSRPAFVDLYTQRAAGDLKFTMEARLLHEIGRHIQEGLARELTTVPSFRSALMAPAFTEGWALYVESLGAEVGGVYRDAPTRFGRLARERLGAMRLVIDTGLHGRGWSRDQALEYAREHVPGQSLAEVDQSIAAPAEGLAATVGALRLKELRARAERALGPRFDIRAFHDVVLRDGVLPLDVLEEQVSRYLGSTP